ncbi:biotin-dependent carboxyltransferase family protein [Ancylobacter pratisalsi]|uniref:Biotin-dependent carboxyltransferase family protein n=1 Tax=Ancylobacter pratisalsi TaxID=1745854 RepID=A0A6P1YPA2_9HYPH|nr:biotin-dependent carboxyltransferase family protein [Ancylobacter pratisalsi]QIB33574.1 biotin-dependent carboxyltransferase family protein [Ancylobacter pratisalsi]
MSDSLDAPHLALLDGGLFSTLQDAGRFGYQRVGISNSGAMDLAAMRIANALVGNAPDTAVVEMTMAGMRFTLHADQCRIALAGADMALTINDRPAEPLQAHELARGDRVAIGRARAGMRGYLAIAGGLDLPPVLGSLSTHTRSRLGGLDGGPLQAGARLPLRAAPPGPLLRLDRARLPSVSGPLRVVLGPQAEAFTDAGISTFLSARYVLSNRADRMGCQLEGAAVEHAAGFNIVSDGIANGSIQIPGHGRPIILLADRQTTGGYPKIATVIGPDLGRLAQLRPGDTLSFTAVSPEEAAAAAQQAATALRAAVQAMEPVVLGAAALSSERLLGLNLVGGVTSARDFLDDDTFSEARPA